MSARWLYLAIFLFLFSTVLALPIYRQAMDPSSLANAEPSSLLGRRYLLQSHSTFAVASAETSGQSHARHDVSIRRSNPFPRYLAERAMAQHAWRGEADVDYVSHVGEGPEGAKLEASQTASSVDQTPTPNRKYNTSITLIPRPTGAAKHIQSQASSSHSKGASGHADAHKA
ncbi:uncharacterized protein LAESUDRAFT_754848 [Laetiporus sulphureus 93-53]|uniref:Uncharacterized protein n=1 Tax=Laetiporus sulphureus 93-53 TaxID=1314785 RepID=A0A165H2J4_9APHY|nr:uncharacterized protein LAESUDRAFT_754848 [Laetiporus sulphureus 93-53]KZT11158.1 hypothetical protein LAESUDRAFT_754848 [Laetiporus sulphureus 93-53]